VLRHYKDNSNGIYLSKTPANRRGFVFLSYNQDSMRIPVFILAMLFTINLWGQQARVKKFTAPLSGTTNLGAVEDKYTLQVFNLESPTPGGNIEKQQLAEIKKEIGEKYPYKKTPVVQAKSTQAATPVVLGSFVADSFSGIPPDNYMAISNGLKAVSVMNSTIAVLNPNGGQMLQRKSLHLFAGAAGLSPIGNQNNFKYDPKIIYDPEADRFIAVLLNGTNQFNWIVLGFSQTNDPAGVWNIYKLYGDYNADTTWFDYPAIAMTHGEFFLTGNKLEYNGSWQYGFKQSVIYQIRKSDGYNGAAQLTYQIWDSINANSSVFIRNLCPVKGGGAIYGPEQYFVSNRNLVAQNDSVMLLKIPDTIGSGNTNLSITVLQSNIPYGVPPDGRQDTTYISGLGKLTTNDARVLGAYIENNEIQFVNATINTGTGSSGIYHGKISNVNTNPTLSADIFAIDSIDFGYPNISFAGSTGSNSSIISFNYTGYKTFAGLGAIYYDGSQFSDLLKVKQGDSVINVMTGLQRWGDYTGSQPFWPSIGKVWIEGIYGRKDRKYGNYMAEIGIPSLAGAGSSVTSSKEVYLYPNPAFEFIQVEFNVNSSQEVLFAIYDISGRMVEKIQSVYCRKGKNMVQLNIASLATGNYILKGNTAQGELVFSNKFSRY
jgi:hypothetical protein